MAADDHSGLFAEPAASTASGIFVNERCRVRTQDGYRVVSVSGITLAHYVVGDRMSEAHAMVSLVEQGWATQREVARAFECSERTVRRCQRRFEAGGLAALGRPPGYPKGRPRLPASRDRRVQDWKSQGLSNREIARRVGVSEKAVRKQLRRLGWKSSGLEQGSLPFDDADPDLSVALSGEPASAAERHENGTIVPGLDDAMSAPRQGVADSNPPAAAASLQVGLSLDADPSDRSVDRVLACLGLLDDAAPLFTPATQVPGAGALLAIPALVESGVFDVATHVYGSIGPAFYGLRTTFVTLLLMALLRIKRPEGLKEHSPSALGRVLGLDRAPEVKTLRRKLARLAAFGRAAELGRALAERRVAARGHAMGFLYVDGHVRAYHGKRPLPKGHLARMRISMPATTDYWVNDAKGDPLFLVTTEANAGLVKMLPAILDEVRALVGDRRLTVVFDRGGWSPKLFKQLIASGFDILTYRKGRCSRLPRSSFGMHRAHVEGREVRYLLADTGTYLGYGPSNARKRLYLRQVTRLTDDGHQTVIVTSRRDLTAIEVAHRMFERWRQENFFKYLREEYALDALVDYGVEPADATRDVPNPRRKEVNAALRKAWVDLNLLAAQYGAEAFVNVESARRTMRGFKIANAPLGRRMQEAVKKVAELEKKRDAVPTRVPVGQLIDQEVVKLSVERKHITDLLKMVAFQAESDLVRLVSPHYRRAEDEGRTLVHSALASTCDIAIDGDELCVALEPLSSPHRTHALAALCESLNESRTRFPGSKLRLRYEVKPPPETSLAFPGPRPVVASNPA